MAQVLQVGRIHMKSCRKSHRRLRHRRPELLLVLVELLLQPTAVDLAQLSLQTGSAEEPGGGRNLCF